ncbi:MAG: Gldg family protein [Candidatus Poribacteria bacterium]|nr:Gldg family protein [Candidatus Poribacteria bacterium]
MANKQIRYGGNTLAFIVIIFGILALINFLSTRRFIRADLTEDKRYTISKATKNVLGSLDDIVTITAYFSTAPAEVARIRRDIKDVLDEYNAFSQKLQIDFVNPTDFDDAQKQELRFKGIPEVQINVVKKDKAEIANVYMGISIGYSGKEETLPVVRSTGNLEYELTSTILKVTTKEAKTVGFLTGHGELDINAQEYQQLRQLLDKNGQGQYNVTSVSLQDGKAVDDTVTTLVVAGVKQPLTEREKYELDQFIMRGGRAIFLVDAIQIPPGTLQGTPVSTGLNDLLEHYGAKLGNNLLIDRRFHDNARFQQGFMTVFQPYPYFVKIVKSNFSTEHTVTNQLEALTLPWTSSLEVTPKESITATTLAKTSEFGQTLQGYYNLMPDFPIPNAETQAYPVAVALEGKFKSFYADKEIPTAVTDAATSTDDSETPVPTQEAEAQTIIPESAQTQIVVVGTAQFLTQMRPDGINFFLNTVDWLTLGDTLIGIRSQTITDRPLQIKTPDGTFREVSEFEKNFIRYLCTVGVSFLVIAFGLVRYFLKRRAKRLVESMAR